MFSYNRLDITNLDLPIEREYVLNDDTYIIRIYENKVNYDIILQVLSLSREILHTNRLVYGQDAIDTFFTNVNAKMIPFNVQHELDGKPAEKITSANLGKGVDVITDVTIIS